LTNLIQTNFEGTPIFNFANNSFLYYFIRLDITMN